MTKTEQSDDCQMPGCWRHTETYADLCGPCAARVADLADSIGDPADHRRGPADLDAHAVSVLDTILGSLTGDQADAFQTVDHVLRYLRAFRAALADPIGTDARAAEATQEAACRWAHGPRADLDSRGLCPVCAED